MAASKSHKKKIIRTAAIPASLYGLLNGQLRFLNKTYDIIGIASKGPLMEKLEEREGIRTIQVNIQRNISPLNDLVSAYRLYRVFRKEKPFMVHSITPKAGLLSMMAAYCARVPKRAHTFTGLIFPTQTGIMKQLLIFFDKLICKFATHIYPEGIGVQNDLKAYNITRKTLKVIANGNVNGVDLEQFNPDDYSETDRLKLKISLQIYNDELLFIYVGRLVNDKGITELITAFCELIQTNKKTKLLLVGSDEGETDILPKKTWDSIHAQPNIICVGQQQDVRPYLAISDVFVFPSYREGFPNVVLEAGAMNLPSIVTDINGSNEIIKQNINGVIIPTKNSKAILKAMLLFNDNQNFVKNLAAESRKNIEKYYERSFVWNELLKEYKAIEKAV